MNKYQRRQNGIKRARRLLRVLRSIHHSEFYADGGEYEKRLLKTRVPCSCAMCGNPRRHFGKKTLQEKKSAQHGVRPTGAGVGDFEEDDVIRPCG